MSRFLRVEMIILALLVMMMVFRSINRGRLRVRFSLLWLLISVGLLVVAVFPGIAVWLCKITRIQTASNLIYLLGILTLLVIVFRQTEIISQNTEKINQLIEEISLAKKRLEVHDSSEKKNK